MKNPMILAAVMALLLSGLSFAYSYYSDDSCCCSTGFVMMAIVGAVVLNRK